MPYLTPKLAQTLARHPTITLTMDRSSHVQLADVAGALDALPTVHRMTNTLEATGTTDAAEGPIVDPKTGSKNLTPNLTTQGVFSDPSVASSDQNEAKTLTNQKRKNPPGKPVFSRGFFK